MMIGYRCTTTAGEFRIVFVNGRWHCEFNGERFDGNYTNARSAAEDLANGHTAWPSCGDPSALGVPEDLSDWKQFRT